MTSAFVRKCWVLHRGRAPCGVEMKGRCWGDPRGHREAPCPGVSGPPLGSLLLSVLRPRVPGSALHNGETAGSGSACGTGVLRTGGTGRGWEEAGGVPRERPIPRAVQGCPKEKPVGWRLARCPRVSWLGTYLAGGTRFTLNHAMQTFGKCYCICFVCEEWRHTESKAQIFK